MSAGTRAPDDIRARATNLAVDDALLGSWPLPMPSANGDKEAKGRILLVGGSPEMPGAIMLAANAALRAGAGKLTVATVSAVAPLVAAQIPEAKVIAMKEDRNGALAPGALQAALQDVAGCFDAVVIGPGFEASPALLDDIFAFLPALGQAKVVLDACAMDVTTLPAWRGRDAGAPPVLLTPHAGEMAHLTGLSKEAIQADAQQIVLRMTGEWQAVVALKGACTFIANPGLQCWEHRGGNSGLGVSGSGDTLAGIIGGLAARGATLDQACVWGVALHARAGTVLAQKYGPVGYLAREIAGEIPQLMHRLTPG